MNNLISAYLIGDYRFKDTVRQLLLHLPIANKVIVHWMDNVAFPQLDKIRVFTDSDVYRYIFEDDHIICNKANIQERDYVLKYIRNVVDQMDRAFKLIQRYNIIMHRDIIVKEVERIVTKRLMVSHVLDEIFGIKMCFPYQDGYTYDEMPHPEIIIDNTIVDLATIKYAMQHNDLAYTIDGIFSLADETAQYHLRGAV